MDSLTFLERVDRAKPQPLYVVHGDEHFLKRQVLAALRRLVLGPDEDGFALSTYTGDKAVWSTVHDDVQTLPFLGPRRLVIVENADPFVSAERARLEKFVARLAERPTPITGVLVLEVKTWTATTNLARKVPDAATISCKTPPTNELAGWCVRWCSSQYGKQLAGPAARLLLDLIGPEMGLLDQELRKLAVYVGTAPRIEQQDVDRLVGRSREEDTWQIFGLIGSGKTGEALAFLGRLLDQGTDPVGLLSGPFSWKLRQIAQVGRLCVQGVPLGEALERVGVSTYQRRGVEQMMRHLGRRRLDQLFDWLLQADQGLKGGSQLPPRTLLERLVVQLSRPR
jgi:DNA polymerase-3 subunit delta